jgi:hypothetical protein
MKNVDRNIFIFGIPKRIAQKSCNHKPTLTPLLSPPPLGLVVFGSFLQWIAPFVSKIYIHKKLRISLWITLLASQIQVET